MIVGFLRKSNRPPILAKLLTFTCKRYGIELIYLTPEGIDIHEKTVEGKIYINDKWENVETPLPKFIDINPHLFSYKKYRKVLRYLKKHSELSINTRHIIKKDKLQIELARNNDLKRYAIPTQAIDSYNELLSFIGKHKIVVIKPVSGLQGRNVNILNRVDSNEFLIGERIQERHLSKNELNDFYKTNIEGNRYIMQKYINSKSNQGDPFDCRIHMEKDGRGNWTIVRMFIRIGIGQKVVSNISQGGGTSNPKLFLKDNFGSNAGKVYKRLKKLSKVVPGKIEKIKRDDLMIMGIDVGIDKEGNPFIFEINSFPIVAPQMSEISLIRSEYYNFKLNPKFKLESKVKKHNKEMQKLREDIESLKKQNKINLKRIKSYQISTSWKITKPLRMFGKVMKSLKK